MSSATNTEIITLNFLIGNEPAVLSPAQLLIQEHLTLATTIWWIVWIIMIVFLTSFYIIYPLLQKYLINNNHAKNEP